MPYANPADRAAHNKRYREEHKERLHAKRISHEFKEINKMYSRKYRKENPASRMYHCAKKRAKASGLAFTIKVSDIEVPTHCPVLGIPLQTHQGKPVDGSPSLDRINSKEGYHQWNIRVISRKANRIKNNATIEELRCVLKHMEESLAP